MKVCPRCGRTFNLLERAVGEAKEHVLTCRVPEKKKDLAYLASSCRGCPAGCLDRAEERGDS